MTDNEAKGRLESFIDTFNICKEHDNALVAVSISKEDIQAFTQAIKALEQQPCEDAISRSEALSVFRPRGITEDVWKECDVYKKLTALPSVTPKKKTAVRVYIDAEPSDAEFMCRVMSKTVNKSTDDRNFIGRC